MRSKCRRERPIEHELPVYLSLSRSFVAPAPSSEGAFKTAALTGKIDNKLANVCFWCMGVWSIFYVPYGMKKASRQWGESYNNAPQSGAFFRFKRLSCTKRKKFPRHFAKIGIRIYGKFHRKRKYFWRGRVGESLFSTS